MILPHSTYFSIEGNEIGVQGWRGKRKAAYAAYIEVIVRTPVEESYVPLSMVEAEVAVIVPFALRVARYVPAVVEGEKYLLTSGLPFSMILPVTVKLPVIIELFNTAIFNHL